jgi:Ca2+-binding RTX toxin-like protein
VALDYRRSAMRRWALTVAASAALLVTAAPADAATVGVRKVGTQTDFEFIAAEGEANDITIERLGDGCYTVRGGSCTLRFTDRGAQLTAGPGCSSIDANRAECTARTRDPNIDAKTGDRADRMRASLGGLIGATVDGGPGDDAIRLAAFTTTALGGDGADTLIGGPSFDFLSGGPGADRLRGGGDADELSGEEGDDSLIGSAGNDRLDGEGGTDRFDGGTGADRIESGPPPSIDLATTGTRSRSVDQARAPVDLADSDPPPPDSRAAEPVSCGSGRDEVETPSAQDLLSRCETVTSADGRFRMTAAPRVGRSATFFVRCPRYFYASSRCLFTLALRAGGRLAGRKRYRARTGRRVRVVVPLSASGRRRLRRARRLRVSVLSREYDRAGGETRRVAYTLAR